MIVWKFQVDIADEQEIEMPAGAELLFVACQYPGAPGSFELWARVEPCHPDEFVKRRILIRGTGHVVDDEPYVGSVLQAGGALVWHVFDGGEATE